ncbi:polysaccharide deacetylase family protein [Bacillus sp. FJAT-27231]|uniref:polysaccharide deacetylase family protein n=1 Tax=Bacillus sp. FJAT-27231 TaxID=1679168 RepID=UPI0006711FF5|nr:polysaccharide deacetylase family protein [Bacillus sp. FJAT-27231]
MDKKMFGVYAFFMTALLLLYPFYSGNSLASMVHTLPKSCNAPKAADVQVDQNKASAIFVMDDGWKSEYTTAYPILKKYGFKGNISVIPSRVDKENYITYKQLQNLYENEEWDLLNHTYHHKKLTSLDKDEQEKEIMKTTKWLDNNCYSRGRKVLIYPYGAYNKDTLAILKKHHFVSARTLSETELPKNTFPRYKVEVHNLTDPEQINYSKQIIDKAITAKGTIVFVNHRFSKGEKKIDDPMYYPEQQFEELVRYLSEKKDKIEVLTYTEWFQKNAENKTK